jgi:hypothetical protein
MDIDSPLLVCLYLLFITLLSVHSYNQLWRVHLPLL